MDLKDIWNSLDPEEFAAGTSSPEQARAAIERESRHPVARLRQRMRHKLRWTVIICLLAFVCIAIAFFSGEGVNDPMAIPLLLMLILTFCSSLGIIPLLRAYRRLPADPPIDSNLREVLEHHIETARYVYRVERRQAYALAVPSPAVGALLGMTADGGTIEEILYSNSIWVVIAVGVIVSPLVVITTNWMNRLTFGKEVKAIEGLLAELDALAEGPAPNGHGGAASDEEE